MSIIDHVFFLEIEIMGNSLQEQLLKAKLVDKKKAHQTAQEKRKKIKQQNKKQASRVDENAAKIQQEVEAQKERDRALNQKKVEAARAKEIIAQIKQLITMNQVASEYTDNAYNFVDAGVVKTINVSEKVHKQLGKGRLAIACIDEQYFVIPTVVAEKIAQRDEKYVIINTDADKTETEEEDDYYADYQIPDDLMW